MEITNEMGVIVKFSQECASAGWEIVKIHSSFPDAVIRNLESGEVVRAEFEYLSTNFAKHKHDPSGCDLVICWKNDWENCPMPVWVLSDESWSIRAFVTPLDAKDREIIRLSSEIIRLKSPEENSSNKKRIPDDDLLAYLQQHTGDSDEQIAEHFGVTRQAIQPRRKKLMPQLIEEAKTKESVK